MSSKKMILGSRDFINGLPDCLISHVLSFLPTKEAASTSVLARRWRYLFALTPNIDIHDSIYPNPEVGNQNKIACITKKCTRSFVDFVDRVLVVHQTVHLNRFSLKCKDVVNPAILIGWILKVLDHGVSDLDLHISTTELDSHLPSEIFVSETLVSLKIRVIAAVLSAALRNVFLPKVKTLCLDYVLLFTPMLIKLLSGCPTLEELVLNNWMGECRVSNTTIKRLIFRRFRYFDNNVKRILYRNKSVSFNTPNLVYLQYSDTIADEYHNVNLSSLVEASLDLEMASDQTGNATDFLMGICNVKILDLSCDTLEVLTYCCKPMPKFNNLIHLTIKSNPNVAWESLLALLKKCPKLETLVFEGLHYNYTNCAELWENAPTCISSSPVMVLKVLKFGDLYSDDDIDEQIKLVKHLVAAMPNLKQFILYYDRSFDEYMVEVSTKLQRLPRVASRKCEIKLIAHNLRIPGV